MKNAVVLSGNKSEQIQPEPIALYYDYFAKLLLSPIAVPGADYLSELASQTSSLFGHLREEDRRVAAMLNYFQTDNLEAAQHELAIDRTALFRGVDPQGLMPPYESFWRDDTQDGIAQIAKEYKAAGFALAESNHERLDYLGLELAFLAVLATGASSENEEKETRITFLDNHVRNWVDAYCKEAIPYARTAFFKNALAVLGDLVLTESR